MIVVFVLSSAFPIGTLHSQTLALLVWHFLMCQTPFLRQHICSYCFFFFKCGDILTKFNVSGHLFYDNSLSVLIFWNTYELPLLNFMTTFGETYFWSYTQVEGKDILSPNPSHVVFKTSREGSRWGLEQRWDDYLFIFFGRQEQSDLSWMLIQSCGAQEFSRHDSTRQWGVYKVAGRWKDLVTNLVHALNCY